MTREQLIWSVNLKHDPRFNCGMGLKPYEVAEMSRPHHSGWNGAMSVVGLGALALFILWIALKIGA